MSYEARVDDDFGAVCPCGRVVFVDTPRADCSGYTVQCYDCSIEHHARKNGFSVVWHDKAHWAYKCQRCGAIDNDFLGNELKSCKECGER